MISLDKYNGSCNDDDELSAKVFTWSKTKSVNVKVFDMLTKRNEVKTFSGRHFMQCNIFS